jgi:hypothetical protein
VVSHRRRSRRPFLFVVVDVAAVTIVVAVDVVI